jgi:hypothetical protein
VNARSSKVLNSLKDERNPQIVNLKVRVFVEKMKDKLFQLDAAVYAGSKPGQLDRIEHTVG